MSTPEPERTGPDVAPLGGTDPDPDTDPVTDPVDDIGPDGMAGPVYPPAETEPDAR